MISDQTADVLTPLAKKDRRHAWRRPGRCELTFSGVDGRHLLMGDGRVTDFSDNGVGITGEDVFVKPGMALALFIVWPDSDDELCVPEARVSWVQGRRFGVLLHHVPPHLRERLRMWLSRGTSA